MFVTSCIQTCVGTIMDAAQELNAVKLSGGSTGPSILPVSLFPRVPVHPSNLLILRPMPPSDSYLGCIVNPSNLTIEKTTAYVLLSMDFGMPLQARITRNILKQIFSISMNAGHRTSAGDQGLRARNASWGTQGLLRSARMLLLLLLLLLLPL